MTTIEALVQEGLIRHLPADPRRVDESLSLADRDLAVAGRVLELDPDWAYAIAYNAMLQAARALLFADGYRPAGKNQHVAVVRFVAVRIGPDEAAGLDRLRRKRHITVYDTAGTIGALEAEGAVRRAGHLSPLSASCSKQGPTERDRAAIVAFTTAFRALAATSPGPRLARLILPSVIEKVQILPLLILIWCIKHQEA